MKKHKISLDLRHNLVGWFFLTPAALLILCMNFIPMFRAFLLSLQSGIGARTKFCGSFNYTRMLKDAVFIQSLKNTFLYLLIQVPIMLLFALILASLLNNRNLKFKGIFRTMIFLPCATSLVGYANIFRALFSIDGLMNRLLVHIGILERAYDFLSHPASAKAIIILGLLWRWTGYNMVFYLAGLQNIDYTIYEAAIIDGATQLQTFFKITVPLLKPTILLTAIMSTTGTLQLFDESVNLTHGGPGNATISMTHYIYNSAFKNVPNFGYASSLSFFILILIAALSFIQMKVGDKRD